MTYISTGRPTGTLRWQAPELFPDLDLQSLEPEVTDWYNNMATDVYAYSLVCHEVNHFQKLREHVSDQYDRCSPTSIRFPRSQTTSKSCLP
jgi:hypothetical protein